MARVCDRRVIYSCVVDDHPKFAYQAWHLAQSILIHCGADRHDIHIQFTLEVSGSVREMFREQGFHVHAIERFGDGKWCNKLSQLPGLLDQSFDIVVLLDTDTVFVGDLRPFLIDGAVQAKIVDLPNPSLATLRKIVDAAGGTPPPTVVADASEELTMMGNANGGLYAIPRNLAAQFSQEWGRWAGWLMQNDDALREEGKLMHVDQVSAALAFHLSKIPFAPAPANINYFVHFAGKHGYLIENEPLSMLHYHDAALDKNGFLAPPYMLSGRESIAVERANRQFAERFPDLLYRAYRDSFHR